jgi:hypothetical protein
LTPGGLAGLREDVTRRTEIEVARLMERELNVPDGDGGDG